MGGKVKCRQSSEEPWRTTIALVKAAKVIVIAASATQMPVLEAGELSSTAGKLPVEGVRPCHPPSSDRVGRFLISGGSWTVVAITATPFKFPTFKPLFLVVPRVDLLRRVLHHVVV